MLSFILSISRLPKGHGMTHRTTHAKSHETYFISIGKMVNKTNVMIRNVLGLYPNVDLMRVMTQNIRKKIIMITQQ